MADLKNWQIDTGTQVGQIIAVIDVGSGTPGLPAIDASQLTDLSAGNVVGTLSQVDYNPEHATDTGTDTYASATNTAQPSDGEIITRDFQSTNTTFTPSLDGKIITDREGNTLTVNTIRGPHTLQWNQTADTYLILDASSIQSGSFRSLEYGLISNRPSASSAGEDAFYLSTDEPRLYRSDGASWVVTLSTSVDTLADLQALDTNGARSVYLLGRASEGDGGEGNFRWDSSDLSTEVGKDEVTAGEGDGGIYVAPSSDKTGSSGAWVRQFVGNPLSVWYATGDGSADDTSALQAADSGGEFDLTPGRYRVTSNLTISSRVNIAPGAHLVPDSGVTITLEGTVNAPDSGLQAEGDGSVQLSTVNINVPGDYDTIQEAFDSIPKLLYQTHSVILADGVYEEDVIIAGFQSANASTVSEQAKLTLEGGNFIDRDPNVIVKSVIVIGCQGFLVPVIHHLTIKGSNPYTNENSSLEFYGCSGGKSEDVSYNGDGVGTCIVSYASHAIENEGSDFGSGINTEAFNVKHGGELRDLGSNTGMLTEALVQVQNGHFYGQDDSIYGSTYGLVHKSSTAFGNAHFVPGSFIHGSAIPINQEYGCYETFFETIDSLIDSSSGGSFSLSKSDGLELISGSNSGDFGRVLFERRTNTHFRHSQMKDRQFRVGLKLEQDASFELYLVTGIIGGKSFGFKVSGGDLHIVSNNPDGETSVNVGAVATGAEYILQAVRTDTAIHFWDRTTYLGAITSNIPSGDGDIRLWDARLTTNEGASKSVYLTSMQITQSNFTTPS